VIGNRLQIRELSPGLIEVVAVGTAVRRLPGIAPHSATLPVQAIVRDDDSLSMSGGGSAGFAASLAFGRSVGSSVQRQVSPIGCLVAAAMVILMTIGVVIAILASQH
jgi:hypothetical protein